MIEICPHQKEEGEDPAGVKMEVRENALEKATTKLRHKDQRADLVQKKLTLKTYPEFYNQKIQKETIFIAM